MFHCAEDYLVTSDPRGGEREENIVNFPCRFECSIPSSSSKNAERDLLFHPSSKPASASHPSPSPSSLPLCRFRMPIKLTSCLVNDRHGHRGKSNSGLIRVAKWQEERRSATENERIFVWAESSSRSFDEHREKTRYNLTQV